MARLDDGAPGWIGEPATVPVWSPAGNEIAWASEDGLVIATDDGKSARTLVEDPIGGRPAWSPNGSSIAYINLATRQIVVVDTADGGTMFESPIGNEADGGVAPNVLTLGGPSWSPDGGRLAFVCWDGAGDEICVVNADGGDRRQMTKLEPPGSSNGTIVTTPAAVSNVGPPSWSPDGGSMAVAAYPERRGAPSGVFVINLERGQSRRISTLLPNSEIRWSPDGESVVFSALEKGRSDAVRVPIRGDSASKLTEKLPAGGRNPALSPNGDRVAVSSGRSMVIMSESGEPITISTPGLRAGFPTWNPNGDAVAFFAAADPIGTFN